MKTLFTIVLIVSFQAFSLSGQQLYFSQATGIPATNAGTNLQNAWAGGINFPIWSTIDINGDGLLDLYMVDLTNNRVSTFTNDGTQGIHAYHDAPQYVKRFPVLRPNSWGVCYDYNCDGKADFFMVDSLQNGIEVWRNDYTVADGLQFTKVSGELLETWSGPTQINLYASSIYVPAFADLDNDGDMDILGFNSTPDGRVAFHKNLSMDLYGTCDSLVFHFEDKCWGDFALCLGTNDVCTFHDPCPPPLPPPPGGGFEIMRRDDTITTICAFDLDADGDKDLLIGDVTSPNCLMLRNAGNPLDAEMDSSDISFPSYDVPVDVHLYVHHSYIDVDNDGKRDLLASSGALEDRQSVWYYKNTNTDAAPVFSFQKTDFLQGEMIDAGQAACPTFFDYNADGLDDILIPHGEHELSVGTVSKITLYENTGTTQNPAFEFITDDYANIYSHVLQFPIATAFGDLDADGDQDMIIGDYNGKLHLFDNSAGAGNPASFQIAMPVYMNIDVGNTATPQIIDMDYDGKLDLVIGEQNGTINYYNNTGTTTSAIFSATPTIDTLGFVSLAETGAFNGFAVPFLFTYNNHRHMVTANMHGEIYYYENIDNNLNGTFTRIDTVISGTLGSRNQGFNIYVSGGDLNQDGLTDIIAGLHSGGLQIYYGSSVPISVNEIKDVEPFNVYPNPATGLFNISFELPSDSRIAEVYNFLGELITTTDCSREGIIPIDLSACADGIYLLKVTGPYAAETRKIVLRK